MWDFSARLGSYQNQYNEAEDAREAGGVGSVVRKIVDDVNNSKSKEKIQEFLAAYNNQSDTSIFNGLSGSDRTKKLARILLPLDSDLSDQYFKKAQFEENQEKKIASNMRVMNAGEDQSIGNETEEQKKERIVEAKVKQLGIEYSPIDALQYQQREDLQKEKSEYAKANALKIEAAQQQLDEATKNWSMDKENPLLQSAWYNAASNLRALGVPTKDVIDTYAKEKIAGSNLGLRQTEFEQHKAESEQNAEFKKQELDLKRLQMKNDNKAEAASKRSEQKEGNTGDAIKNATTVAAYEQAKKALVILKAEAEKAKKSLLGKVTAYVPGSAFQTAAGLFSDGWSKAMSGAATGRLEDKLYRGMADPNFFNPLAQDYLTRLEIIENMIDDKIKILTQGGGSVNDNKSKPVYGINE